MGILKWYSIVILTLDVVLNLGAVINENDYYNRLISMGTLLAALPIIIYLFNT